MNESSPISVLTKWLDQYLNFEHLPQKNIFWLDTMEYLCSRFNHPENACPSFHVAGSKGKGSTSMMIACILQRASSSNTVDSNENIGLYTSPHIIEFIERIGTPHGRFPDSVYEKSVRELMNGVESIIPSELPGQRPVTWFELVTLFAMICFRNAKTEWAVYEVGLGGRLDATNVIMPKCCCIGPIELEHTEYLGDTVEKIAVEKGGIIKPGVPVIIAPQKPSVRKVFEQIAAERGAPIIFVEDVLKSHEVVYIIRQNGVENNDFAHGCINGQKPGMEVTLNFGSDHNSAVHFARPIKTTLRMLGSFQAYNAAVAALAVKQVFPDIDESIIELGLSDAVLPARFEIVSPVEQYPNIPELIMDGAHTVNSVRFTMETFEKLYGSSQSANLLFACAADKDIEDIVPYFKGHFNRVMLTKPGDVKAADMGRLEIAFSSAGIAHETCADYIRAIGSALAKANEDHVPLLVTGSFYLVAEVKKYMLGRKCVTSVNR